MITVNDATRGLVKGQFRRFINGHNRIKRGISEEDYAVEDLGFGTPCWLWLGALNKKGYGHITRQSRHLQTHRLMWEQLRGPIPTGMQIDHLCKVRACCNPDHLEPVSPLVNVHRSGRTQISEPTVAAIRAAREAGEPLYVIGARFGVSTSHVHNIVSGKCRAVPMGAATSP